MHIHTLFCSPEMFVLELLVKKVAQCHQNNMQMLRKMETETFPFLYLAIAKAKINNYFR